MGGMFRLESGGWVSSGAGDWCIVFAETEIVSLVIA